MTETWWVDERALDDGQKSVIRLPLEGSYLVTGPPGSGKTNLLLLRANYLQLAQRPNIQIIVFTRTLREFIAAGSGQYDFPLGKIRTSKSWQRNLLFEYGVKDKPPEGFDNQREYYTEKIGDLIAKRGLDRIYETILLDEAQDYTPEEIEIFRKLSSSMFAVADSRQKIYDTTDSMDKIRTLVDKEVMLRHHYRNGHKICLLADAVAKDTEDYVALAETCNYDEKRMPSTVDCIQSDNLQDQAKRIGETLAVQLEAYPNDALGVVCPKREDLYNLWGFLSRTEIETHAIVQEPDGSLSLDPSKRIHVCTLHAAKGLEFRAVHFAAAEGVKKSPNQRNLVYTAITRAKTSLTIYHSDSLPGYFESAIESIGPRKALPTLEDVFGGRR